MNFRTKKDGDSETFYLHTLRFYMLDIIDDTWKSITWVLVSLVCKVLREEINNLNSQLVIIITTVGTC